MKASEFSRARKLMQLQQFHACIAIVELNGAYHHTIYCKAALHGTADTGSTGDWREYYYHGDRFFTGCSNDPIVRCQQLKKFRENA
ncbi:MAG: hypothetical protein MW690_001167 [Methanophagales archaeon]|nr:hypothetical protein [Methanophagales archaeon]MCU4139235.1 hypothetical protein [Methanophagales archaeon]